MASLEAQMVESACNAGDLALIPGLGKSPEEGTSNPLPVVFPGESHGQRSLAGYSPRGRKESDTTKRLALLLAHFQVRGHIWEARF